MRDIFANDDKIIIMIGEIRIKIQPSFAIIKRAGGWMSIFRRPDLTAYTIRDKYHLFYNNALYYTLSHTRSSVHIEMQSFDTYNIYRKSKYGLSLCRQNGNLLNL